MVAGRFVDSGQRHRRVLLPAGDGDLVPGRAKTASPRCSAELGAEGRRRDAAGGVGTGVRVGCLPATDA